MSSEKDDSKDEIDWKKLYDEVLTKNIGKFIEYTDFSSFLMHATQDGFFEKMDINDMQEMLPSAKGKTIVKLVQNKEAEEFRRFLKLLKQGSPYIAKILKNDVNRKKEAIEKKKAERERKVKEEQKKVRRSFEDIRKTAQFDGRIIEIEGAWFEETVQKWSEKIPEGKFGGVYNSGKYGDVFKYKEDNARALIIRRIQCENSRDVEEHVKHEISWGRLKHFAINPLLAKGEDAAKHIHYLVYPSMESGTLIEAIAKDREEISSKDANSLHLMLEEKRRLSIMYQIAAGLVYMHKAVTNFRGAVSHGGVHSENILLDRKLNVRLTNFGTAREEVTLPGGLIKDYQDFGNVILELLLSQPPKDEDGKWLAKDEDGKGLSSEDMKELMGDHNKQFEAVWRKKVREKMPELAEKCVQGNITVANIEDEVKNSIEKIHRTVMNDGQTWNVDEDRSGYCDICVIRPKIADVDVLKHNKMCKVCVCVACLRNSYLNPIECPTCHEDIKSPIGQEWGAILIAGAGNDEDGDNEDQEKEEKMFVEDMNKVYEKITSKYPLIMGIKKELVFRIYPNQPETSKQQLQSAFKQLHSNEASRVTSLLVYYSGHYYKEEEEEEEEEEGGFLLNNEGENDEGDQREEEFLKKNELKRDIHTIQHNGCHRVLIFLDCCNGPKFESSSSHPIIQVNACRPEEKSVSVNNECSLFTSYLLKGLSGMALEDKCFNERELKLKDGCDLCKNFNPNNNGFISVEVLSKYIDSHVQKYNEKKGLCQMATVLNLSNVDWKDATIAYFIDKQLDFEFELQHESKKEKVQLHQLPEKMTDLKEKLLKQCSEKGWLPKINSRDADMLAVMASSEAGKQDEFVSMEDVVRAWNENRQLIVLPRPLKNLHLGKVGWFPGDKEGPTQAILELFGQDRVKECCKIERVKSVPQVKVPLRDDGVKTLRERLEKASNGKHVDYVCKQLLRIKNNKEIQKKQGDLVICWQPSTAGEAAPNFLSVQIKEPKALSPRLGATAVLPTE